MHRRKLFVYGLGDRPLCILGFFSSPTGGNFDQFGAHWIVLKSAWYGVSGLLLGCAILCVTGGNNKTSRLVTGIGLVCLSCFLVNADVNPNLNDEWKRSQADRFIKTLGNIRTGMLSHNKTNDTLFSKELRAVIAPRTVLQAVSNQENSSPARIEIRSGSGALREIVWSGDSFQIEIYPFDNGDNNSWFKFPKDLDSDYYIDLKMNKQVTRCSYTEARVSFSAMEELMQFLSEKQSSSMNFVYNDHGILVLWSDAVNADQLTIEVYQLLVNGKNSSLLSGAKNGNLKFLRL